MSAAEELRFVPLGGVGEIGLNVSLYGLGERWMMVDLGITFADDRLPGITPLEHGLARVETQPRPLLLIAVAAVAVFDKIRPDTGLKEPHLLGRRRCGRVLRREHCCQHQSDHSPIPKKPTNRRISRW